MDPFVVEIHMRKVVMCAFQKWGGWVGEFHLTFSG